MDLVFALENQGGLVVPVPQQIFGKIEPRSGKPFGAGHFLTSSMT